MRKTARELCFKLIFENLFVGSQTFNEESFHLLCDEDMTLSDDDKAFVVSLFDAFLLTKEKAIEGIKSKLVGFTFERLVKVDVAILCLAYAEYFILKTDEKIIINECVELAKKFSLEKSPKFVNGILANLLRE